MAKNPTNFTPGPGDDDWDGIDHRHVRDLAMIAKDYPTQQLKHFRHKETGQLVEYYHGSPVFYLSRDGDVYCYNCANQEDAEPPIIAGQQVGQDDVSPKVRTCNGCGKKIYPIRIIRQNANARYIYNFQTGTVLCIGYETPVAMYLYEDDTIYETDINWSASLSKQLGKFSRSIANEPSRKARFAHLENTYYPKYDTCPQEQLDAILLEWTGDVRLAETRSAHENYNQGVEYRVNTRQYVGRYNDLRRILKERRTHKLVITDKGEGMIR